MRWIVIPALLSLAAPSVGAQHPGPPLPGDRKEWTERYGQFTSALLTKDYKTFRRMATPDASWLLVGGRKLNEGGMQSEYARKLNAVRPNTQFTCNVTRLTVTGAAADVERTEVIAGFYHDSKGKNHRAFDGSAWLDHWVKTPQGWKIKSARQANETLTVDGMPGNPYSRAALPPVTKAAARR